MAAALEEAEVQAQAAESAVSLEAPATPGETNKQRFLRLAPPRVNKIIKAIDVLAHLSNTNAYEYNVGQVAKMFGTMQKKLDDARDKFHGTKNGEADFAFDEDIPGVDRPTPGGEVQMLIIEDQEGGVTVEAAPDAGLGGQGNLSESGISLQEQPQQPAGTAEAISSDGAHLEK